MSKIALIKKKYDQIEDKTNFLMNLAMTEKLNFFSIRNHHFGGKWKIPDKYHDIYLKALDKELKGQG